MSKKRSLIFTNIPTKLAIENGFNKVAVPVHQRDKEIFNKINGDYEVTIWKYRNLKFHRKLFYVIDRFICEEFFINMLSKWDDIMIIFNFQIKISEFAIQKIRFKNKDDVFSLIYICKWMFLPLEEDIKPDGRIDYKVSSISFEKMDNVVFEEFYNKCLDLFTFILDCNRQDLEGY